MTSGPAIPVLMYHSVGRVLHDWAWPELTVPWRVFESHLRALRRAGYQTADLYEFHAHTTGEKTLPEKTVVLTFDDGYVDNWTYAAPLLKRYGFTGTVLVTPEFVDHGDSLRPTLEDVWAGRLRDKALEVNGFMSWPELKHVAESGVLSVQCHAMTHTWYPVSDRVVDFHRPGDGIYWLDWNEAPESKPDYMRRLNATHIPYGTPVYDHRKSLEARRFFPDEREAAHVAAYVGERGSGDFFARPGWRGELDNLLSRWREEHPSAGRMETLEERAARTERELVESKEAIESRIGREVDFFIFPGGGYDDETMRRAREIYRGVTISSRDRWKFRNRPGENPGSIVRRGVPEFEVRGRSRFPGGSYLVSFLDEYRGSRNARRCRQVQKLFYMAAGRLGLWR